MKALKLLSLLTFAAALSSCELAKQFDYAAGTSGSGYFLTVSPKPQPPPLATSAKQVTNVRP
ncbi:hypothetical protein [Prosthecobacter dejongeii]|uniref:Lipoprotein n=1 Tax=Prosthecobacter dejongeii TaxID=48465 RepID=A0A7W7YLA4_9BACT|nr:hypothetical protein [Prosthecobacter dejongeii]MBB5038278.1 hypothetical protein [Prosthecobacter dejongeii]